MERGAQAAQQHPAEQREEHPHVTSDGTAWAGRKLLTARFTRVLCRQRTQKCFNHSKRKTSFLQDRQPLSIHDPASPASLGATNTGIVQDLEKFLFLHYSSRWDRRVQTHLAEIYSPSRAEPSQSTSEVHTAQGKSTTA